MTTKTDTPPSTATTTTIATVREPRPAGVLDDFDRIEVQVGGENWTVAVADDAERRAQGLMNVTDLGDLDGMLFVFDDEGLYSFWMKDTLLPLDIAFFDAGGAFVDVLQMAPCTTEECPTYTPADPFTYALESRQGDLIDRDRAITLVVPGLVRG